MPRRLKCDHCIASRARINISVSLFHALLQVMILITGAHKSFALYKAIEEGVNHMWTVSAFQQHPNTLMICDEDATLELRVKTVKYFKVNYSNIENGLLIYTSSNCKIEFTIVQRSSLNITNNTLESSLYEHFSIKNYNLLHLTWILGLNRITIFFKCHVFLPKR